VGRWTGLDYAKWRSCFSQKGIVDYSTFPSMLTNRHARLRDYLRSHLAFGLLALMSFWGTTQETLSFPLEIYPKERNVRNV
jgi:hypothetical protein